MTVLESSEGFLPKNLRHFNEVMALPGYQMEFPCLAPLTSVQETGAYTPGIESIRNNIQ